MTLINYMIIQETSNFSLRIFQYTMVSFFRILFIAYEVRFIILTWLNYVGPQQ